MTATDRRARTGWTWPPSNHEPLLRAATGPPTRARADWEEWALAAGDGPLPIELARLRPLLWHNLKGVADPRLQECAAAYERTLYLNRLRVHAVLPVLTALRTEGVEALWLKGPALIARCYRGDLGLRPMGDVDVLVRPAHIGRAAELLNQRGWAGRAPTEHPARPHAAPFVSRAGVLDLHERALEEGWPAGLDTPLWEGATLAPLLDTSVLVPNATDLLLLACTQAGRWDWDTPYRWIPDAMGALGSGNPIDWDRFADHAARRKEGPPVAAALLYLATRMEAAIPEWVPSRLGRERATAIERVARRARAMPPERRGLIQAAALHWMHYRRLRGVGAVRRGPWGMLATVQRVWGLPSPWAVPSQLLRRGIRRVRGLWAER